MIMQQIPAGKKKREKNISAFLPVSAAEDRRGGGLLIIFNLEAIM